MNIARSRRGPLFASDLWLISSFRASSTRDFGELQDLRPNRTPVSTQGGEDKGRPVCVITVDDSRCVGL